MDKKSFNPLIPAPIKLGGSPSLGFFLSLQHCTQVASPDLVLWLNYFLKATKFHGITGEGSIICVSFMAFDTLKRQKKCQH